MNSERRDRLILHYLNALDGSDVEQMQRILEQAEQDAMLTRMIVEAHEAYDVYEGVMPPVNVSLNGHHHREKGSLESLTYAPSSPPTDKRRARGVWVALIAASLTLILTSVIISNRPPIRGGLSDDMSIPFNALQPITTENVNRLTHLATLGTGMAYDADWSPDGALLAVSSASGVYLHNSDDVTAPSTLLGGRSLRITESAFNSNGTILAGIHRNSVMLWNVRTGEVLDVIETGLEALSRLQFSADDQQIAVGGCARAVEDETCQQYLVRLWDVATGDMTRSVEVESIQHLTLTPDFNLIAYITGEPYFSAQPRTIPLVDVESGEILAVIETLLWENNSAFAFSSDGNQIFMGGPSASSPLRIIDIADLLAETDRFIPETQPNVNLQGQGAEFAFMQVLPGNMAVFAIRNNGQVIVRSAESGEQIRNIVTNVGPVRTAAVNSSTAKFAVVASEGGVALYDFETAVLLNRLTEYGTYNRELAFGLDDTVLISGGYSATHNTMRQWNIADLTLPEQLLVSDETMTGITDFVVNSEGTELAYLTVGGELRVHDLETGADRLLDDQISYGTVAYTPDGDLVVLTSRRRLLFHRTENEPDSIPLPGTVPSGMVTFSLSGVSSDGQVIALGDQECNLQTVSESAASVRSCVNSALNLWTLDLETQMLTLEDGGNNDFSGLVTFSRDNEWVTLTSCSGTAFTMYDSPGEYSAQCTGGEVRIWNIGTVSEDDNSTGTIPMLATIGGYRFAPSAAVIAPIHTSSQRLLVTTSFNEAYLEFWMIDAETENYESLGSLENPEEQNTPAGLAFNEDGTLMAFSYEGQVQIWGVTQ